MCRAVNCIEAAEAAASAKFKKIYNKKKKKPPQTPGRMNVQHSPRPNSLQIYGTARVTRLGGKIR